MDAASGSPKRSFTVEAADGGQRLDVFLAGRCPDLSRAHVQRALAAGRVVVDGRPRPKGYRLRSGQRVLLEPLPPPPSSVVAEDLPLRVVHEDTHLLVIDKEAGQVVHPAPGHARGTLANALVHRCRQLAGPAVRPGIVHRLDRDTSGLLVVALTEAALRSLAGQLRSREMKRLYLALAWGAWPQAAGVLHGNVGRNPTRRQRMAVLPEGGRPAVTRFEVAEDFGFVQLCRVRLETGRTHQIRVHFAHHGHPIVGDPVYGEDGRARNVHPLDRQLALRLVGAAGGRQLLHATELSFVHPAGGELMTFRSPPPPSLQGALDLLRARGASNLA